MLKTSTRIFAASTMAALLIGINTGAFACDKCAHEGAKASKSTKPVAKTLASAKVAPKAKIAAPKVAVKVAPKGGVKLASLTTKSAKAEAPMCAACEAEKAAAKK